ncbi:MAG: hypothetical protein ACLFV6_03250 [Spirulinaceae cyanobacterium]
MVQCDRADRLPHDGGAAIALSRKFRAEFERTMTPGIPAFVFADTQSAYQNPLIF